MLKVGYAFRDITPEPGIALSGFAARCDRPSEGVDDPLVIHALAVEQEGSRILLLVFDLLALGSEAMAKIHAALDQELDLVVPRRNRVFCCTHTHSGPATITLLGAGIMEPTYLDRLAASAAEAGAEACRNLQPATMRLTKVQIPGQNYNRRKVLKSGRVAMAHASPDEVVKVGPTYNTMLLVRFDDEQGRGIAAISHWACHACTVCTQRISADFPGELCRRLAARHKMPFLFLQGACGNLNPFFEKFTREEMLRNVDSLMAAIGEVTWPVPVPSTPFGLAGRTVPLRYAALPPADEMERYATGLAAIAATGAGPEDAMATLANILNVTPDKLSASPMTRHIASVLAAWARNVLAHHRSGAEPTCDLALTVWRMGPLAWCFIAAEVFVETAFSLQAAFPNLTTAVVGYAGPCVGYLPTDEALAEGGYESASAYRFYGHPAPFAPGSEPAALAAIKDALAAL